MIGMKMMMAGCEREEVIVKKTAQNQCLQTHHEVNASLTAGEGRVVC